MKMFELDKSVELYYFQGDIGVDMKNRQPEAMKEETIEFVKNLGQISSTWPQLSNYE